MERSLEKIDIEEVADFMGVTINRQLVDYVFEQWEYQKASDNWFVVVTNIINEFLNLEL